MPATSGSDENDAACTPGKPAISASSRVNKSERAGTDVARSWWVDCEEHDPAAGRTRNLRCTQVPESPHEQPAGNEEHDRKVRLVATTSKRRVSRRDRPVVERAPSLSEEMNGRSSRVPHRCETEKGHRSGASRQMKAA